MIRRLELENYRGFKQYTLSSLARVNLLVGMNSSGKTAILEAVNLLAAGGDPRIISRIARQRGEINYEVVEDRFPRRTAYVNISHFFYGHEFTSGSQFSIKCDDRFGKLSVHVISDVDSSNGGQQHLFDEIELRPERLGVAIRADGDVRRVPRLAPALPASDEGAISFDDAARLSRVVKWTPDDYDVHFITQDSPDRASLNEMWDKAVVAGNEMDAVRALAILGINVSSVHFLTSDRPLRSEARGGILIGIEGSPRRLPIGSFGEGMRRMLSLALSLGGTRSGTLLVDEIDTGLHYSIMGDMWHLVVELAKRYDIQAFATTHSLDCIRGLAWLCSQHPELGEEVSLQKIEPALDEAVALDAEQIKIAAEQGIEVR
jgi:hypothetical protein